MKIILENRCQIKCDWRKSENSKCVTIW